MSMFERWCAEQPNCADVGWDMLCDLYEEPAALERLPSERVRMVARSMIEACMHDRHMEVRLPAGCGHATS